MSYNWKIQPSESEYSHIPLKEYFLVGVLQTNHRNQWMILMGMTLRWCQPNKNHMEGKDMDNIFGLNSKAKQWYLKERLRKDKGSIMIIQETKIHEAKLKGIVLSFKLPYEVIALDSRGSVGGLTILWNPAEVVFEDWVSSPWMLTEHFRHIGSND